MFWDHEFVGTDKEIRPLFSSAVGMFRCLAFSVEQEVNFIYHDTDDDPNLLPLKKELLLTFLSIDPEGVGGPAREYWTTWACNHEAEQVVRADNTRASFSLAACNQVYQHLITANGFRVKIVFAAGSGCKQQAFIRHGCCGSIPAFAVSNKLRYD